MYNDARLEIRCRSVRVFVLGMIAGIIAFFLIAIPSSVNGMSGRPPVNPEQLENGDYLQKLDMREIGRILIPKSVSNYHFG